MGLTVLLLRTFKADASGAGHNPGLAEDATKVGGQTVVVLEVGGVVVATVGTSVAVVAVTVDEELVTVGVVVVAKILLGVTARWGGATAAAVLVARTADNKGVEDEGA
jgi:hypothetical protein